MSAPVSLVSLVKTPWKQKSSQPAAITPLPGLTSRAIEGLKPSFPGTIGREFEALLRHSCGLEGSALGAIDFTGEWHSEEPLAVFRPSLTLAVDKEGRRWIAEGAFGDRLPGTVWCIFPDPQVALLVSENLSTFLAALKHHSCARTVDHWLADLTASARAVWKRRAALATKPGHVVDPGLRAWAASLPPEAYVYDLRNPGAAVGWPYGIAGPAGRFYRCGRSPVFAVSAPPASERWSRHLLEIAATFPVAQPAFAQTSSFTGPMSQLRRPRSAPDGVILPLEDARGAGVSAGA